jgi:hypothetical protein
MKTNIVFKRTHNQWPSRLGTFEIASDIGSEPHWAETLAVSRTTVRAVLGTLAASGLIAYVGRRKVLARHPVAADYFPEGETEQVAAVCPPHRTLRGFRLLWSGLRYNFVCSCTLARQFVPIPFADT